MQANNNQNQVPDPSAQVTNQTPDTSALLDGPLLNLLNNAVTNEELQQMNMALDVDAYDVLAAITTFSDVTGTSQLQTGQMASTVQVASTLQTT